MFNHWSYNPSRSTYTGTYEVAKNLPSGLYDLTNNSYGEPQAEKLELRKDTILNFENGPLRRVLNEISRFWNSAAHYKKLGVAHKRGILLYGPPGCGKTGIISSVIEDTINRNGIAFQVDSIEDFKEGIVLARQIEKGRPITAVIEDIEKLLPRHEETLLEVMDGASSLGDGIIFLTTTNHLKKIPPRVRCRPSRIDTLIEINFPSKEQRYEYLLFLLDKEEKTADKLAAQWAAKTDNFSLAMLKELVISVQVYGKSLTQSIDTLKAGTAKDENDDDT